METLLNFTLFGSELVFYISVISLFIILIFSDPGESLTTAGGAVASFYLFNYFWGNLPLQEILTLKNIGVYTSLGFVFAIVRTYFKGRELDIEERKHFDLKEAIFRWWFLFPIYIINWIWGELLKDLYNFVYVKIKKFFEFIFNLKKD